ncbi:MAG TPA: hypothetical protein DET40_00945, partial [Lentisphaeria bacterium]|nr:hypothetical protein [Lentisphaeria bacterium]
FHVKEDWMLARRTEFQSAVCRDSCVEFFTSPAIDGRYFNFEFNCIGTLLLGYGEGRVGRIEVPWKSAGKIQISTSLPKGKAILNPAACPVDGYVVECSIPFKLFNAHAPSGRPKAGDIWMANFYKCGDELPEPHWGSWSPVKTQKPDFHRPEHFGKIVFVS